MRKRFVISVAVFGGACWNCSGQNATTSNQGSGGQGLDAGSDVLQETGGQSDAHDGSVLFDIGSSCPSNVLCGATSTCCGVGEECVNGACMTTCGSGVRCGGGGSVCCSVGEACVQDACFLPVSDCQDSVDCNALEFCEPTLGKCLPQTKTSSCVLAKPPATFEPVTKWKFEESLVLPGYNQAVSAPLVVDGNRDRVPEVYVTMSHHTTFSQAAGGKLFALDGATGKERWGAEVDAFASGNEIEASFSPALADLEGDGVIDIVAMSVDHRLIAFEETGKLKWKGHKADDSPFFFPPFPTFYPSTISIADMDGDGKGEVVLSGVVFDASGKLISGVGRELAGGPVDATYNPTSSIIADIDGDSKQEVVTGNGAYALDGTPVWEQAVDDGFPGIVDFERDGTPELVVVGWKKLRVQNAKTGVQLASVDLSTTFPGTPVIADFDGDAIPDIGVTYGYEDCRLETYNYSQADGLKLKWAFKLGNCSGFLTATAFDFEGDGKAEVLAHSDCSFFVLDGSTGTRKLQVPASHATWTEFVSVVDVDGDRSADLLFSANDHWNGVPVGWCSYESPDQGMRHGVFVFSDPEAKWMPTRMVWNQQAYHITNIKADGTLPRREPESWGAKGFNNYRVSYQGLGLNNAPDVAIDLEVSTVGCPTQIALRARVKNLGDLGAPAGLDVVFYQGTDSSGAELGRKKTSRALLPGMSEVVEVMVPVEGLSSSGSFFVTVDQGSALGALPECNESNNTQAMSGVSCPTIR